MLARSPHLKVMLFSGVFYLSFLSVKVLSPRICCGSGCAVNIHYNSLQYCQHVLLPVLSIFPGMWPPWLDIYVTTQPGPRQTYQDWEYKT